MKSKLIPLLIVGALVIGIGAFLVFRGGDAPSATIAASGTVEATEADLGFQLPGRIESINAREGDQVALGGTLARLEQSELTARRAAAVAQLASARALLTELQRGARPAEVQQARAPVNAARERMEEAGRILERTRRLEQGGAASRESLEQAQSAFDVARAQYEQAREQLSLVEQGPRRERIDAQLAVVRQAEAAIAQVDAQSANAVIKAPFPGTVTVRHREPGEAVPAGAPVVTIMNPHDRWVRIYVREDQIGRVAIGQRAEIRSDSNPDRAQAGQVVFVSNEAEFTPRNVQTTEERAKLVYAVKVAISGDSAQALKPGMPADVLLLPR
jgi:HlyD family secretion protein